MLSILASPAEPPKTEKRALVLASAVFQIRAFAQVVFGSLLLTASFYLALCYITFDFYGALKSPFFAWLRQGAFAAQILYFPAFAAALLSLDGTRSSFWKKLAGALLVFQIAGGFLLYFLPGLLSPFGWALVYGPNLRNPVGTAGTYAEALACLVPIAWVSAIRVASSVRAAGADLKVSWPRLAPFLIAAFASSILYAGAARLRLAAGGEIVLTSAIIFSVAALVGLFAAIFLFLQWTSLLASRTPNPGLAQFAIRWLGIWLGAAVVLRKIVFSLLGFNSIFAEIYALAFSFAAVIFFAAQRLNSGARCSLEVEQEHHGPRLGGMWGRHAVTLAGILVFFYLFAVKLVTIDWGHIIGSVTALLVEFGLLWFFASVFQGNRTMSFRSLSLFSLGLMAVFAGMKTATAHENLAQNIEEYADYNSSMFAIGQVFTPSVRDDQYEAWYQFLREHANMRQHIRVPDVHLVERLERSPNEKPNIFIFVIDALRRDYVSAYNPSVNFTPGMDAFARESVVFQHAYSPYAGTALADAAMWSGYQQVSHIFPEPVSRLNNLQKMLDVDGYDCYISFNPVVARLESGSPKVADLSAQLRGDEQQDFGKIVRRLEQRLSEPGKSAQPVFVFAQPANVHTLSLAWHREEINIQPHPGFDDGYASAVQRVDQIFGQFIEFLKKQRLYDNSIVILTADHGESLGEMGRESHVSNLAPQVIQIPLIIHLPRNEKSKMFWDSEKLVTLHDITPTLYKLLGHRLLKNDNAMIGHPLFSDTSTQEEGSYPDHYLLMSSYMPVFGILSADRKKLFFVDASLHRTYFYDLDKDPKGLRNSVSPSILNEYKAMIRQELLRVDQFYGLNENDLGE